ncbi:hypothetical protein KIN20_023967 [Parelaphostrongylus tenuis]|uniref:Uncharacterized protein n=1 Tax=Parelaphostrongylus tenuis TaxID=148309 RepID=A0AAD5QXI4_PARTN|nr:hypothetical protein KIN20_023967 [Parelaphostrongylus tenuis]
MTTMSAYSTLNHLTATMMDRSCTIVGNTVTGIFTNMGAAMMPCNVPPAAMVQTTNIMMANWSRSMCQSVVNRAVLVLALGPFGSQFFSATATAGGS